MSKPAIDLFAYVDNHEIIPVLQAYSLPLNLRLTENQRFYILQEIIAGETRLQGLEGHQRDLMERINQLHLNDLLVELDKAQDAFEEAVGVVWLGSNLLLAAIMLHYATVWALCRKAAELEGIRVEGLDNLIRHWWELDYKYLRAWKLQTDQDGDSPARRVSRSKLYSGNIRGAFFKYIETLKNQVNLLVQKPGWVAQYISKDDKATCLPCKSAVGFYILGQGPFPGQVCKGAALCRCKRVMVYDPARYKILHEKPDFSKWDWSMGVT